MRFGLEIDNDWLPHRPRRYRALFLSDMHLGNRGCQSDRLIDFLRNHEAETVYLVGDFTLESLDSKRKLVLVALAAPVLGAITDLAFKPTRASGPVLGVLFAAAGGWVFLNLLKQKTGVDLALYGAGLAAFMVWNVAATMTLEGDGLRAGAAGQQARVAGDLIEAAGDVRDPAIGVVARDDHAARGGAGGVRLGEGGKGQEEVVGGRGQRRDGDAGGVAGERDDERHRVAG